MSECETRARVHFDDQAFFSNATEEMRAWMALTFARAAIEARGGSVTEEVVRMTDSLPGGPRLGATRT